MSEKKWVWISNTRIEFKTVIERDTFLARLRTSGQLPADVMREVLENGSAQRRGPVVMGGPHSMTSTFVLKEQ